MCKTGWSVVALAAAVWATPVWAQTQPEDAAAPRSVTRLVQGRVIDEAGKPVVGITIGSHWISSEEMPIRAVSGVVKTDEDGRFRTELTFYYGRSQALLALDAEHQRGGLAAVDPRMAGEPITIKTGPLVRLHGKYACKDLGNPVGWTNSMFMVMPGRWRISEHRSKQAEFSILLPPGLYQLQGYGGSDVGRHRQDLTLTADKLDADLGEIDLAASAIAKLKGKPAPTLHPTDARGVSKTVQIADYKGKWVALEFWGHWCGPCIAGAIPRMMEIHDDHADEHDRYVVLTVHSSLGGKSFAEVDEKLVPIVRDTWGGRKLPFPILLDADGQIQKTFDVSHWPTTLLFDPEGKLVGEVAPDELELKLKPIPLSVALPRKLDRDANFFFDDPALKQAIANLRLSTHTEFSLDPDALKSLGLGEETKVPLTIAGRLSLRSAVELLLDPLDLAVKVGPKGYIITRKPPADSAAPAALSEPQARCAARIERRLRESRVSFAFDKTPLAKVAAFFEQESTENVVLDPRGRLQGKIDPGAPVTGTGKDVPLGEALERLVGPLGLRVAVRDEVIVLEAGPAPAPAASAAR